MRDDKELVHWNIDLEIKQGIKSWMHCFIWYYTVNCSGFVWVQLAWEQWDMGYERMEQLETADAPPASSCPVFHSVRGSISPPHLHLSFPLTSFTSLISKCVPISHMYTFIVFGSINLFLSFFYCNFNFFACLTANLFFVCLSNLQMKSLSQYESLLLTNHFPFLLPWLTCFITHSPVHSVSGRQTSGLQGASSSPPLTVWICHLLWISQISTPFPGSCQSKADLWVGLVAWGWMRRMDRFHNGGLCAVKRLWIENSRFKVRSRCGKSWGLSRWMTPSPKPTSSISSTTIIGLLCLPILLKTVGHLIGCVAYHQLDVHVITLTGHWKHMDGSWGKFTGSQHCITKKAFQSNVFLLKANNI